MQSWNSYGKLLPNDYEKYNHSMSKLWCVNICTTKYTMLGFSEIKFY